MKLKDVEAEIKRVDELLMALKEKRMELLHELKKFKLPHYCPFCTSENIIKAPEFYRDESGHIRPLKGCYYCKDCDRGFRLSIISINTKEILKKAIEGKEV